MKTHRIYRIYRVISILSLSLMTAHADLKIQGGGFEIGLNDQADHWTVYGKGVLTKQDFAKRSGDFGVWLKSFAPGNMGGFYQDVMGLPIAGEQYTFSGYFSREINARLKKVEMKLEYLDAEGKVFASSSADLTKQINASKGGEFALCSVSGKVPRKTFKLRVAVFYEVDKPIQEAKASLFFDDAQLIKKAKHSP